MPEFKKLYDEGKIAIIRGLDILIPTFLISARWISGTPCEPEKLADEGWVGRAIRDLDPKKEKCADRSKLRSRPPRAMAAPGVPVASGGQPGDLWRADQH